ncbi:hypothetical protein G6L63_08685 [Agrobacterium vitis]|nr:hypothetical protein [Agrobacterium vitis]UJL72406.1 phage terminase large subunit family protein [Agrobacterium vitis]
MSARPDQGYDLRSTAQSPSGSWADRSFRRSDQRFWHIKCPECGVEQVQDDQNFLINRDQPHKSVMPGCCSRNSFRRNFRMRSGCCGRSMHWPLMLAGAPTKSWNGAVAIRMPTGWSFPMVSSLTRHGWSLPR